MSKQSRLDLPLQIFCRICIYQLHLRWLDASRTENLIKAIFQLITWKHEHFCRTSVKGSNAPCLPSSIPIVPCQFHWHSYFWGLEQFLGFNLKQFDELIQDVTCMLSVESHLQPRSFHWHSLQQAHPYNGRRSELWGLEGHWCFLYWSSYWGDCNLEQDVRWDGLGLLYPRPSSDSLFLSLFNEVFPIMIILTSSGRNKVQEAHCQVNPIYHHHYP